MHGLVQVYHKYVYNTQYVTSSSPTTKSCLIIYCAAHPLLSLCDLQLLTNHYEQNWKYYCLPSGWGSFGTASEDELLLTKKIFWGVFDSLSQRVRGLSLILFRY